MADSLVKYMRYIIPETVIRLGGGDIGQIFF